MTIILFLLENIQIQSLEHYWELWYYIFLCVVSAFKLMLKYIARKIDIIQIKLKKEKLKQYGNSHFPIIGNSSSSSNNINVNINNVIMSFEWITELIMSIIYWANYRYFLTYYMPFLNLDQFIFTILLHLLSEAFKTIICKTRFSYQLYNKYINNILKIVLNIDDDCNYSQWLVRYSIDIMVRIYSSVLTAIYQIAWLFYIGKINFKSIYQFNNNQFNKALNFNIIALVVDIVIFVVSYMITLKCFDFNLVYPFRLIYKIHKKFQIICFALCFVVINYY